jgi:hypothetical protein
MSTMRFACLRWAAVAALAFFVSATASAQTTAPAPQPAAPLEAGDTAPPPGAPPTSAPPPAVPVSPLSPVPAAAPAAVEAPLIVPPPPAPRERPFYRRDWFWGAVAVVVATGIVVLALTLNNADPVTPNTRLGDMRAF